jgi:transcriptional regulator with XRE-family HTH domain
VRKQLPEVLEPGQRLRQARERLQLKFRDVEEASQRIADGHGRAEFVVCLSRLADIENKGTVPSLYRLYSLCAIYGLEVRAVLLWYGIDLRELAPDAAMIPHSRTRPLALVGKEDAQVALPELAPTLDLRKTSYLARSIQKWGTLPVSLLKTMDPERYRYAFIGTEDWSMYPVIQPGSFLQIEERKRKIVSERLTPEADRPIYFIEHRLGYRCGWCTERDGLLIVQSPAASGASPEVFRWPSEVDIIGQVVGVAMRLDLAKRRRTDS